MSGLRHGSPQLKLILPTPLRAALIEHAMRTPDLEICGLIGGNTAFATTVYPIANVAEEPATSFFMAPREQLRAMQCMRARNETLVGIYHSHPSSPAMPSARDLALAAYPGVAYLIVSLQHRSAPALACFQFDGRCFAPLTLEIPAE